MVIIWFGCGSGFVTIIFAAFADLRPPSSINFIKYVPVNAGTSVSLILPASCGIISVEFAKLALVDVSLVCLTDTVPPCVTSTEVEGLKRNLIKLSETGSDVRPVGSSGIAVLPTASKVKVVGNLLGSNFAL